MKSAFDYELLQKLVEDREVSRNKHPEKDLYVYSYNKVWYPEWTEELRWARGLVLDGQGNVVACPFKKFFNYSEAKDDVSNRITHSIPYHVQEKLDGSLGILFWYEDQWIMNTRGSFVSEQAIKGMQILKEKYPAYVNLDRHLTYLFEIIYPDNQIVISYGEEKLVLLAVMDPKSMQEIVNLRSVYLPECFEKVKTFMLTIGGIIDDMKRPDYTNSEGFVVLYSDGFRVKFKYEEYVRLHKIVSDFKPVRVIELMRDGGNVDELINSLPDEFRQDIISVRDKTYSKMSLMYVNLFYHFFRIQSEDKKTFALEAIKLEELKPLLFELWKRFNDKSDTSEKNGDWALALPNLKTMVYNIIIESWESDSESPVVQGDTGPEGL